MRCCALLWLDDSCTDAPGEVNASENPQRIPHLVRRQYRTASPKQLHRALPTCRPGPLERAHALLQRTLGTSQGRRPPTYLSGATWRGHSRSLRHKAAHRAPDSVAAAATAGRPGPRRANCIATAAAEAAASPALGQSCRAPWPRGRRTRGLPLQQRRHRPLPHPELSAWLYRQRAEASLPQGCQAVAPGYAAGARRHQSGANVQTGL